MNPILKFYRGEQHTMIEGEFACEACSKITFKASYDKKKQNTYWRCRFCETENLVEGVEMHYE